MRPPRESKENNTGLIFSPFFFFLEGGWVAKNGGIHVRFVPA